MAVTCDICGATSNLDDTFVQKRKSFRRRKISYCPACWVKERESSFKSTFIIWGILATLGVIIVAIDPKGGWFFLNIFIIILFAYIMIIPHELGHALVAKWLRRRVLKIIVGSGRLVRTIKMFGFIWEIRQFPVYGMTLSFATSARLYRLKQFLLVIAGPLVNLGFLLVAIYILQSRALSISLTRSLSPVMCLVLANVLILVTNLFPYNTRLVYGKLPSDGLSVIMMPFLSKAKIEQILPLHYVFEGDEFLSKGQFQAAKACFEQGLTNYPDNSLIKINLGVACLELGEFKEARTIFKQLLEKDETDKLIHAIILNNLAFANILIDKQGLLEESNSLSAQAYQSFPWVPAFKGTRGTVLVELGKFDEGIALLKQAMEENEAPRDKAINAVCLAIAEMRKGNRDSARQYLDTALQLDANCLLIKRAREELSLAK